MKRIIFTLLHSDGSYMLSRNFRLQRVGDVRWVLRNYEIRRVSLGIDELMILDVSRETNDAARFHEDVQLLVAECFIPVTVGGRIRSMDDAARLFGLGADKILLNSPFYNDPHLCESLASRYGSQALIAGIDVCSQLSHLGAAGGAARPFVTHDDFKRHVRDILERGAGEILVQSVDQDGTGSGLDLTLAGEVAGVSVPVILMGGIGHAQHIVAGLSSAWVDAVATANLFNFLGNSFIDARRECRRAGVSLAEWADEDLRTLQGAIKESKV